MAYGKSKFADRGKVAEDAIKKYLAWWEEQSVHREANRLTDTKAAGRIIKAAAADFEYYCGDPIRHGLIEVKETEHEFRLSRSKVSQLARLRKREKCGGVSYVLVYHSTINCWRAATIEYLATTGDKGSWNLSDLPLFAIPEHALHALDRYVWDRRNSP